VQDGDALLEQEGVKNRNYFWYTEKVVEHEHEQGLIRDCINEALLQGINVLYSGNPLVWEPNLIYLPSKTARWENLSKRSGFCPTLEQFQREETVYREASKKIDTVRSIRELADYIESTQYSPAQKDMSSIQNLRRDPGSLIQKE
jgi:hypothetical protein